jgi:hypothetical protein
MAPGPGAANAQGSVTRPKEAQMPELLEQGLPERVSRSRFDFSKWTDGRAWKFVRGEDYESSTETVRANVKRWAKEHGYEVELRPYPATDRDGKEIPVTKTDPVALGVQFVAPAKGASA